MLLNRDQDFTTGNILRLCEDTPEKHRRNPEVLALAAQAQEVAGAFKEGRGTRNMPGALLELAAGSLNPGHIARSQGAGKAGDHLEAGGGKNQGAASRRY